MATNDRNRQRRTYSFYRARPVDPLSTIISGGNGIEVTGDQSQVVVSIDESIVPVLSGFNAFTGSVVISGSLVVSGAALVEDDLTTLGDLYVSGTVFATEYKANVISSSIIFQSGSTKWGDTSDDVHEFTGSARFEDGLSGSLTQLTDGTSYLVGVGTVTVLSQANGQIIISGTGDGGGVVGEALTLTSLTAAHS